jgi:hypothetical protein
MDNFHSCSADGIIGSFPVRRGVTGHVRRKSTKAPLPRESLLLRARYWRWLRDC